MWHDLPVHRLVSTLSFATDRMWGEMHASHSKDTDSRRVDGLLVGGLLVATAICVQRLSGLGFLGWDCYPILAASLPDSPSWWLEALTRPLAEGLMPAQFYRPLLALSLGLEWQVWGPRPAGYLATQCVLFGLCALALHRVAVGLGAGRPAARVAVAFFFLHPVALDVLPYLPRRPELLCTLFALLALELDRMAVRESRKGEHPARAHGLLAAALLATVASMAAKETGVAVPVLIAVRRGFFGEENGGGRVSDALRGAVAHGACVTVMLAVRSRVLGGIGGYADTDVAGLWTRYPRVLARLVLDVFAPAHAGLVPALSGATFVLAGLVLVIARRNESGHARLRLAMFSASWVLTFAGVYAAAGRLSPWYLLIVVAGTGLGVGALADLALSRLRLRAREGTAVAVLIALSLVLVSYVSESTLLRPPRAHLEGGERGDAYLAALERRIRASPTRERFAVERVPRLVVGRHDRQVPVLLPRSLPGWARITFPERELELVEGTVVAKRPIDDPDRVE